MIISEVSYYSVCRFELVSANVSPFSLNVSVCVCGWTAPRGQPYKRESSFIPGLVETNVSSVSIALSKLIRANGYYMC